MRIAERAGMVWMLIGASLLVLQRDCFSADCPPEDQWVPTVSLASAALQERRATMAATDESALAVAVFVRRYPCDLLASDPDLLPASIAALEKECTKLVPLQSPDEGARSRELYRLMDATQPDFVALVWENRENGTVRHKAIASNGAMAVRYEWPGYGQTGDPAAAPHECGVSPWVF